MRAKSSHQSREQGRCIRYLLMGAFKDQQPREETLVFESIAVNIGGPKTRRGKRNLGAVEEDRRRGSRFQHVMKFSFRLPFVIPVGQQERLASVTKRLSLERIELKLFGKHRGRRTNNSQKPSESKSHKAHTRPPHERKREETVARSSTAILTVFIL